ncbi:unnamed protein product [Euphydryas editha]|uniref:Reverse transcriptase n=1 Tax=Euphydryas editha TaxID=104508 RepID=A0AAU9TNV0_EUPED|nr:unnamed protein product [Euphydryas editha]
MKERREDKNATPSELHVNRKKITRLIHRDLRRANAKAIYQAIEQNRGSKYSQTFSEGDKDPRATLARHYTDELPEVSREEIVLALNQHKNEKGPGKDGIIDKLIKAGRKHSCEQTVQDIQFRLTHKENSKVVA